MCPRQNHLPNLAPKIMGVLSVRATPKTKPALITALHTHIQVHINRHFSCRHNSHPFPP
jgi:hypothetical protein